MMAENAGIRGMLGGQSIDIASEDKEISLELLTELQEKKTGAFIEAAIVTPYYLYKNMTREQSISDETAQDLRDLAAHTGLAFQIKDDILDLTADEATLGKTAGKDVRDEKPTYATMFGVERAKLMMDAELDSAYSNLDSLEYYGFDTKELKLIVDYVAQRDF